MKGFVRMSLGLSRALETLAGLALMFMVLLTVFDVIFRYLGRPVTGTYELVGLAGAVVIGFVIPQSTYDKAHVTVDFLVENLSVRRRLVTDVITRLFGILLFVLLGWNFIKLGATLYRTGEVSLTLNVPFYPIPYGLGVCSFIECLILICDIARTVHMGGIKKDE